MHRSKEKREKEREKTLWRLEMTPGNPLAFTSTDAELDLRRRGVSGGEESQTPSHP